MAKVICTELQKDGASGPNITLDTSKNVTCENNLQVDGNVTVTGTIPADKLTGNLPAISGASLTNLPASGVNPNLLINGAMSVAQRRSSATGITTSGYYSLDRWTLNLSNYGTWSLSQTTGAPKGFGKILRLECSTADASPAAGDDLRIMQRIEAQSLQHLKYGESDAQDITLSFWNKCNQASKVVCVHIYQPDGGRHVTKTFTTHSSGGSWQHTTITFPGDTGGTITNDNGAGLEVQFYMGGGTSFTGGSANTTWSSYTAANTAAGQTLMLADTVNNYFDLTGVKLEVGTSATTFEDNDIGNEIWRCQRYFQQWTGENCGNFAGRWNGASDFVYAIPVAKPLRASPSIECKANDTSGSGNGEWKVFREDGASTCTNVPTVRSWTVNTPQILMNLDGLSSGTDDRVGSIQATLSASGFLRLSAEL